ncbi:hypothetical protein D3C87_1267030 [compost metagenome]
MQVDDDCESYNIRGYAGDNSNSIYENGVVVASCDDIYIGGKHRKCGRSGVAIFNGVGVAMNIEVNGIYQDNDFIGIRARGITRLRIVPGTLVKGNGNVLVGGQYSANINVSNSGGAPYNQGAGAFICQAVNVENGGVGGVVCDYISSVTIDDTPGADNCQSGSGSGVTVSNANFLWVRNNAMRSSNSNQQSGFVIASSVATCWEWGNRAPGSVVNEVANASPLRKGQNRDTAIPLGSFTPTGAYPNEGSWNTTSLGNAISTLVDSMQRNGQLNKN